MLCLESNRLDSRKSIQVFGIDWIADGAVRLILGVKTFNAQSVMLVGVYYLPRAFERARAHEPESI